MGIKNPKKTNRYEVCKYHYNYKKNLVVWRILRIFKTMEKAEEYARFRNEDYEKEYGSYPSFDDYAHIRPFINGKYIDEEYEDEKDYNNK